jgi:membrane protein DedA with SNARE-associated domain
MLSLLFNSLLEFAQGLGYGGIVLMMTIESSFFPLPSEIVIPPFAYLASKGELNIFGVIISGTLGSLIGASFNYFLAKIIGQAFVYKIFGHRYAKYIFLNQQKMRHAEEFFLKNADASTFFGRLIPGVRHLISIPAGFFRMNFRSFLIYTAFGSLIWVSMLASLGYFFGQNEELLMAFFKEITIVVAVLSVLAITGILLYKKKRK